MPPAKKSKRNAIEGVPEKCPDGAPINAVELSSEKKKKEGEKEASTKDDEKQAKKKKVVQKPPTEESATTAFVLNLPWTVR